MLLIKIISGIINQLVSIPRYLYNYSRYFKTNPRFKSTLADLYPCLNDNTIGTGYEPHYTYHLAWALRKIMQTKPIVHVDIASSLNFAVTASAIVPVQFYDYREVALSLHNLETSHADLTKLHFQSNSIKSLSCMHVVEHIGLGRYGDEIDVDGDIKAVAELKRVLSIDGNLFFVVPVGKSRLRYNAHRIYSLNQIKNLFSDMKMVEFSFLSDDYSKGFKVNPSSKYCDTQNWGMGCFWFKKI